MTRFAFLEAFDTPEPEPAEPLAEGPSEEWLDGHSAGYIEGRAAAEAESGALSAELVQILSDMGFTAAEARIRVLDELGPLFHALIAQFLPEAARATLAPRIVAEMMAAAAFDSDRPPVLHLAPQTAPAVQAALDELAPAPVRIAVDSALGPLEAVISAGGQETALDPGRLAEALGAALSNLIRPAADAAIHPEEHQAHG